MITHGITKQEIVYCASIGLESLDRMGFVSAAQCDQRHKSRVFKPTLKNHKQKNIPVIRSYSCGGWGAQSRVTWNAGEKIKLGFSLATLLLKFGRASYQAASHINYTLDIRPGKQLPKSLNDVSYYGINIEWDQREVEKQMYPHMCRHIAPTRTPIFQEALLVGWLSVA